MTWPSRRGARSKYAAVATVIDGIRFASKREAHRYRELVLLLRAGKIQALECQPAFPIEVAGRYICEYRGDYRYVDLETGEVVVEDVKGMKTREYTLKRKLVEALYPFQIREVR